MYFVLNVKESLVKQIYLNFCFNKNLLECNVPLLIVTLLFNLIVNFNRLTRGLYAQNKILAEI